MCIASRSRTMPIRAPIRSSSSRATPDRRGERIWLVYEDLGLGRLDLCMADRARVTVAIDLIAALHACSAEHPMLPDVRAHGGDLGEAYLIANVRDAVRALAQLRAPRVGPSAGPPPGPAP